jgi:hypothetical protein
VPARALEATCRRQNSRSHHRQERAPDGVDHADQQRADQRAADRADAADHDRPRTRGSGCSRPCPPAPRRIGPSMRRRSRRARRRSRRRCVNSVLMFTPIAVAISRFDAPARTSMPVGLGDQEVQQHRDGQADADDDQADTTNTRARAAVSTGPESDAGDRERAPVRAPDHPRTRSLDIRISAKVAST